MNDLREITREPYFLEKAGFVRRDEGTTDVVRWVWYERTVHLVESEVTLVLQVEFELSISDYPFVRTIDNFSYSFNGVYLKITEGQSEADDSQSEDRENFLKNPHIMPLGAFMTAFVKEEPREIDRFKLKVNTRAQLRSLCKMLGCED
jgi:hypothetical protein